MKKLLIGLLMLVSTNLMATKVIKAPLPAFPVTVTQVCVKDVYYSISRSEAHVLVEKIYAYSKLYNAWFPKKCKRG